ncbi:alpha/beta hydrolase-fold protein [Acidianus manzaensis]|uniref:S-formylglutathione hydrolase n=1 Tax=Acidianus manzaensis TaxID=282676 RepID=A0A1W6K0I1_9CREN|nr:alpha/beta hydrolase-fold protein [Acidianus manzaensis]ARM76028.1 esterase [Acidianus manzaensis]
MELSLKFVNFESSELKDNPLNDPFIRKIGIIEPEDPIGKPIIFYLSGYLSSSLSMLNYDPLSQDLFSRISRLMAESKIKGSIVVLPDMFTKVGGNQYINSKAVGNYENFLFNELIPFFKDKYKSQALGLIGKSSGGYGSIVLAMKHKVDSIAVHSADSYFEYVYLPEFPRVINNLRKYSSPEDWLNEYWKKDNKKRKEDLNTLNIIGMSAFYSPSDDGKILLPFDLDTGEIIDSIWKKWLEKDPVRMIEKYHENLSRTKIFMDVGIKDEFNIQYGMRILHSKMKKLGIEHNYEEYNDGHLNTSYRLDISLSFVEKSLYEIIQ